MAISATDLQKGRRTGGTWKKAPLGFTFGKGMVPCVHTQPRARYSLETDLLDRSRLDRGPQFSTPSLDCTYVQAFSRGTFWCFLVAYVQGGAP